MSFFVDRQLEFRSSLPLSQIKEKIEDKTDLDKEAYKKVSLSLRDNNLALLFKSRVKLTFEGVLVEKNNQVILSGVIARRFSAKEIGFSFAVGILAIVLLGVKFKFTSLQDVFIFFFLVLFILFLPSLNSHALLDMTDYFKGKEILLTYLSSL